MDFFPRYTTLIGQFGWAVYYSEVYDVEPYKTVVTEVGFAAGLPGTVLEVKLQTSNDLESWIDFAGPYIPAAGSVVTGVSQKPWRYLRCRARIGDANDIMAVFWTVASARGL